MIKKVIFSCFLILFVNFNMLAADGCSYSGSVYTTNFTFFGTAYWEDPIPSSCPPGATSSTQYANITATASSCRVYTGGFSYVTGVKVTYNILNCPIDDYLTVMLLAAGGVGVFFLRNRLVLHNT